MFRNGYSEAFSRLISVVGAVVLALIFVGGAVVPAEVAQTAAPAHALANGPALA